MIALDLHGMPVPGVAIRADAFQREFYSHRRRLIGGFYAFDQGSETRNQRDEVVQILDAKLLVPGRAKTAPG